LVSCGGPEVKIPLTYTPEKIAQIQTIAAPLDGIRTRMSELQSLIEKEDWIYTRNLIHGPFGQIRQDLTNISRTLLPKDQKEALQLAKDFFNDLNDIDAAAIARNYGDATSSFRAAVKDFDSFLEIIPSAS
jgi:photosystem II protein PsbQ